MPLFLGDAAPTDFDFIIDDWRLAIGDWRAAQVRAGKRTGICNSSGFSATTTYGQSLMMRLYVGRKTG
jgi:hypothetical protein